MSKFYSWYKINKNALEFLYMRLLIISNINGIKLKDDSTCINNFIIMMYNESNKELIDKDLHPDFFKNRFYTENYEKYKILDC